MVVSQGSFFLDALETGLREDCPYGDITTELLGIEGLGRFRFISREDAVVSGTYRLKEFFESKKLCVGSLIKPGTIVKKGDVLIEAEGNIITLFRLWRICQTYLTVLSAIATQTRAIVDAARQVNPRIQIVVACRKAHLGMRADELEAVRDGGAVYHRNSLSDTILITQNHMRVLGGVLPSVSSLQHKLEFEPSTVEEAYAYAKAVEIMLLDHFEPDELDKIAGELKKLNSALQIGVAGGITLGRVKEFAPYVDIIVLSSVLYAAPLDITCKIEKIGEDLQ